MQIIGLVPVILLSGVAIFQIAVAFGLEQGDMVMGGRFPKKLPMNLRVAAGITGITLFLVAFVFAVKSEIISSSIDSSVINTSVTVFTIFLLLNTLGNAASKSNKERLIMTPITLICFACGIILTIS